MFNGLVESKITFSYDISFELDIDDRLEVTIDTERLRLSSIHADRDIDSYCTMLYQDPEVMATYGDGVIFSREEVETRLRIWDTRWQQQDPFSTFTVNFNTDTDDSFLGAIGLGPMRKTWPDCLPSDMTRANTAEIHYIYQKNSWGKGVGSEAAQSIVNGYAPALQEKGYQLQIEDQPHQPLTFLYATAREDNPASWKILGEKCGLDHQENQMLYGADRRIYWKKI